MKFELLYKRYSEKSILIEWPQKIDENILENLLLYKNSIKKSYNKEIVEVIDGYNSLLILYSITIENFYDTVLELKSLYSEGFNENTVKKKIWEIPVCYSTTLAPDLEMFSQLKSLTFDQIIGLHSSVLYKVYFIGFLPGFLYLGGLDKKLSVDRKTTPSSNIEKGSVAIGGDQTGIYPINSPGGWYVIGKSPLTFFDSNNNPPCFVQAGDYVQFIPIEKNVYNAISSQLKHGSYKVKCRDEE